MFNPPFLHHLLEKQAEMGIEPRVLDRQTHRNKTHDS